MSSTVERLGARGEGTADNDDIVMDVARLIWRRGLSVSEFHEARGVDLDDMRAYHVDDVAARLAGILGGRSNPPDTEDEASFQLIDKSLNR